MRMKYLIFALLILIFMPLVSSELSPVSLNECIPIIVPSNATSVTLTNVNSPSPNSTIIIWNKTMTNLGGGAFNYTFCNTTRYGTYTYGFCENSGFCSGNSFTVNGSGQNVSQTQIILILIGLSVIFIFALFFFILSLIFKHPGTKIFLMAMSTLTLVVLIGIVASNATTYLAEFPAIITFYNNYYIVMISLTVAAMAGLMLWLVYYSFTLFNKSRGTIPDAD